MSMLIMTKRITSAGGVVLLLGRQRTLARVGQPSQSECRGEMFPGRKVSNINELGDKRSESPVKQKKRQKMQLVKKT